MPRARMLLPIGALVGACSGSTQPRVTPIEHAPTAAPFSWRVTVENHAGLHPTPIAGAAGDVAISSGDWACSYELAGAAREGDSDTQDGTLACKNARSGAEVSTLTLCTTSPARPDECAVGTLRIGTGGADPTTVSLSCRSAASDCWERPGLEADLESPRDIRDEEPMAPPPPPPPPGSPTSPSESHRFGDVALASPPPPPALQPATDAGPFRWHVELGDQYLSLAYGQTALPNPVSGWACVASVETRTTLLHGSVDIGRIRCTPDGSADGVEAVATCATGGPHPVGCNLTSLKVGGGGEVATPMLLGCEAVKAGCAH